MRRAGSSHRGWAVGVLEFPCQPGIREALRSSSSPSAGRRIDVIVGKARRSTSQDAARVESSRSGAGGHEDP